MNKQAIIMILITPIIILACLKFFTKEQPKSIQILLDISDKKDINRTEQKIQLSNTTSTITGYGS